MVIYKGKSKTKRDLKLPKFIAIGITSEVVRRLTFWTTLNGIEKNLIDEET